MNIIFRCSESLAPTFLLNKIALTYNTVISVFASIFLSFIGRYLV